MMPAGAAPLCTAQRGVTRQADCAAVVEWRHQQSSTGDASPMLRTIRRPPALCWPLTLCTIA
jgi:hypothetical protein